MLDIHNDLKNKMEHALGSDTYIYIYFFFFYCTETAFCATLVRILWLFGTIRSTILSMIWKELTASLCSSIFWLHNQSQVLISDASSVK